MENQKTNPMIMLLGILLLIAVVMSIYVLFIEKEDGFDLDAELQRRTTISVSASYRSLMGDGIKSVEPEISSVTGDGDTYTVTGEARITGSDGASYSGDFTLVFTLDGENLTLQSADVSDPVRS